MSDANYKNIEVSPISGALGALITGVELNEPLQDPVFEEIYNAFSHLKKIFQTCYLKMVLVKIVSNQSCIWLFV